MQWRVGNRDEGKEFQLLDAWIIGLLRGGPRGGRSLMFPKVPQSYLGIPQLEYPGKGFLDCTTEDWDFL